MIVEMSATDGYEIFLQHVQFEVTGKCNMRCQHCRAWNEPKESLPLDVMRNILDFVATESEGVFGVTISGGEPFVRNDFTEIVRLVASFPARPVVITTNGSLCTEKRLRKILNAKGTTDPIIQISLDSAEADEHDRFRGYPGAYDRAIESLKRTRDLGLSTAIRATVRAGQVHLMEPLVYVAQTLGIKNISFGTVVPFGRASGNSMGMTPSEKKEFLLEVTRLREVFSRTTNVETEDPLKFSLGCKAVWNFGDIEPEDELLFGGCTAGITTFNVTSDGILTPCAVLPCKILDARGKTASVIGEEYARSQVVKDLLSRSLKGKCGSCSLKRLCGGCRAIPFALSGELMGEDSTCWH